MDFLLRKQRSFAALFGTFSRNALWPILAMLLAASCMSAGAQSRANALTDAELEKLRDLGPRPDQRVAFFQKMMDERIADIQKVSEAKRVNDRGGQLHDLMDQFVSLSDELVDNLDEFQSKHLDIRKAVAKLSGASEKWGGTLSAPPDDPAYNVTRKLALAAAADVHETAANTLEGETAWFREHPPAKGDEDDSASPAMPQPVVVPR